MVKSLKNKGKQGGVWEWNKRFQHRYWRSKIDNLFQHSDQKDIKKEKKKNKVRKGKLNDNKMILRIKILIQHIKTLKE